MKESLPNDQDLDNIIKHLQKKLRIQDWNIKAEIVTGEEYNKRVPENCKDNQAFNQVERKLNDSYILINQDVSINWYQSLVHELIHLCFDHLETCEALIYELNNETVQNSVDDIFNVALERTVERMAEIFVSVYPVSDAFNDIKVKAMAYIDDMKSIKQEANNHG